MADSACPLGWRHSGTLPGHSNRRQRRGAAIGVVVPGRPPALRAPVPAERLDGGVGSFVQEDLPWLAVMAPARRASGFAREAARQPRCAPIRCAGAGESRDIDEHLREEDRVPGPDVRGQPPKAQPRHAGRRVRNPPWRDKDEPGMVADRLQPPEPRLRRPPGPAVARGQPERPRLPSDPCEPGLAGPRDRAQAPADNAVTPPVVALLDQAVPDPVRMRPGSDAA